MMFSKILKLVFALVIIAASVWYTDVANAQMVVDGLVSRWTFDKADIDGKNVKDVQGNNNGTMQGNPKSVEGKIGDALDFDGAADHVVVPSNDNMNFGIMTSLSVHGQKPLLLPAAGHNGKILPEKETLQ